MDTAATYRAVTALLATFGLARKHYVGRVKYAPLKGHTANVPGAVEALRAKAAEERKARRGAEAMVFQLAAETLSRATLAHPWA